MYCEGCGETIPAAQQRVRVADGEFHRRCYATSRRFIKPARPKSLVFELEEWARRQGEKMSHQQVAALDELAALARQLSAAATVTDLPTEPGSTQIPGGEP
jgi:peptidyl-tRNA hydrolase